MHFAKYTQSLQSSRVQRNSLPVKKSENHIKLANQFKKLAQDSTAFCPQESITTLTSLPDVQITNHKLHNEFTFRAYEKKRQLESQLKKQNQDLKKELQSYKALFQVIQAENKNLHQHNQYLIYKARQFKKQRNIYDSETINQKMCKELYVQALIQMQNLKKQKFAYKNKANEIKQIVFSKMKKLQGQLVNFVIYQDEISKKFNARQQKSYSQKEETQSTND